MVSALFLSWFFPLHAPQMQTNVATKYNVARGLKNVSRGL